MKLDVKAQEVDLSKIWMAALASIVAAVVGNVIVGTMVKLVFNIPPEFLPLGTARYVIFTIIGMIGAIVVYVAVVKSTQQPVRMFTIVAVVFLIISYVPDILMLVVEFMPGATVPGVVTLMAMHTVPALAAIFILPRMTVAG